jgi:hypothetical protein
VLARKSRDKNLGTKGIATMADDDTTTASDGADDQSSEEAVESAADPQKVIEDLRKRQSGADKARDTAIAERNALKAQLDSLLSGKSGQQDQKGEKSEAEIRAEVAREYEQRLAEERAQDLAKVLDAQFPTARKKFPNITDAAQLAELEAVFGDTTPVPPKPVGNNPPKSAGGSKSIDDMSVAELRKHLDEEAQKVLRG